MKPFDAPNLLRLVHSDDAPLPRVSRQGNTAPAPQRPNDRPFQPLSFAVAGPPRRSNAPASVTDGPLAVAFARAANRGGSPLRVAPATTPATASAKAPSGHLSVAAENQASVLLAHDDARWVLAVRVNQLVEGGAAAVVTPAARRTIVQTAKTLGIRSFDAHMIIAIVQDALRSKRGGLSRATQNSLAMVRPAEVRPAADFPWPLVVASLFMGFILFSTLAEWITGSFR